MRVNIHAGVFTLSTFQTRDIHIGPVASGMKKQWKNRQGGRVTSRFRPTAFSIGSTLPGFFRFRFFIRFEQRVDSACGLFNADSL